MWNPSSRAELLELLKFWPFWLLTALAAYLAVMMILYPYVGLSLSALGIIATSNLSHHPTRVILTFVLVMILIWSGRNLGPSIYADSLVPEEESAPYGYGPSARP